MKGRNFKYPKNEVKSLSLQLINPNFFEVERYLGTLNLLELESTHSFNFSELYNLEKLTLIATI